MVVRTIRPDTVFIPYHWPGGKSANRLTHRTLDPRSKIPEFKVRRAASKVAREATMNGYEFYVDPSRCIGCQSCVGACAECGTHRGKSMIHVDFIDRRNTIATAPMVCMHCEDPTCAQVCPADAIKTRRRRRGPQRAQSRAASAARTAFWHARSACRKCTSSRS